MKSNTVSRNYQLPPIKDLHDALNYCPLSGVFTWKDITTQKRKSHVAGNTCTHGYMQIQLGGKFYLSHRLAFFMYHGVVPTGEIDHINGIKSDNRIENLRVATRSQNCANTPPRSTNKLGIKGVRFRKDCGKFTATIMCNGMRYHLGYFVTSEEACVAYSGAAALLFGEFSRNQSSADCCFLKQSKGEAA